KRGMTRRTAVLLPSLLLALASGCGANPPTPVETPPASASGAASAAASAAPAETATPAEDTKPAPPADADVEPPKKPQISCEPKAGSTPGAKTPKLAIAVDRSKVDLDGHKLDVTLNRPACKVELTVVGESGKVLAEEAKAFNGAAAGTTLSVSWSPVLAERVLRIEIWGHDTDGSYVGVALTPWSVSLAHEEVNFENDSDVIRPSEAPKLEKSLAEIDKILDKLKDKKPSLFIKGHTDTMGSFEHNMDLSRRRAKSIATWLRGHGLKIN